MRPTPSSDSGKTPLPAPKSAATSQLNPAVSTQRRRGTFKIVAVYVLISGLWIIFSDQVAALIAPDPQTLLTINTLKGWGYTMVTALLLYWLIRRHTIQLLSARGQSAAALTDQLAVALKKARMFEEIQQYAVELEDRVTQRTRELTAANTRLTELDRLKDQFVSMVSHEYRTPLTTILSSAEMLEHYSTQWTDDRRREYLRKIAASVKHMTDLLDDILVIGKADANKLEIVTAPIDLVKYCSELVDELQLLAGGDRRLGLFTTAEQLPAEMDSNLLRHILSNLLSNAIKYSAPGTPIEFELTREDHAAVFIIRDQGIGISLEDQARLFESFHRGSNTQGIAGTGLGLAIVKRAVNLQQGTIEVISQDGVGTTVTVRLPLGTSAAVQGET